MTLSLGILFIWALAANVLAMFPSRRHHWPAAYFLVATGVPLIVWVFSENNALICLLALAIWCSVLRWPLLFLLRWVRRLVRREGQ
jgi:Protein of unknown function (DUF2484)